MKIKRKTALPLLVALLIIFSQCAVFVSADDVKHTGFSKENLQEDLANIYRNIELGENNELKCKYSEDVMTYLENKAMTSGLVNDLYDIEMLDFDVNAREIEEDDETTVTKFIYCVEANFRYVGASEDSGYAAEVMVAVNKDNGEIVDIFESMNAFDEAIRDTTDSTQYIRKMVSSDADTTMPDKSSILETTDKYVSDVLKQKRKNDVNIDDVKETTSSAQPRAATSLNYTAIKNWARQNFNKANPSSGGSGVPYYDFSKIKNNYDCTNFVSHALLAGGAKPYKPSGATGIIGTGWYYTNLDNRSSSWSGVSYLYSFLTSNRKKGPGGSASVYTTNGGTKKVGEILQFSDGTKWVHSTIITGFRDGSTAQKNYALVTGRTSATSRNDNKDASTMWPNKPKRTIIALKNYS